MMDIINYSSCIRMWWEKKEIKLEKHPRCDPKCHTIHRPKARSADGLVVNRENIYINESFQLCILQETTKWLLQLILGPR